MTRQAAASSHAKLSLGSRGGNYGVHGALWTDGRDRPAERMTAPTRSRERTDVVVAFVAHQHVRLELCALSSPNAPRGEACLFLKFVMGEVCVRHLHLGARDEKMGR